MNSTAAPSEPTIYERFMLDRNTSGEPVPPHGTAEFDFVFCEWLYTVFQGRMPEGVTIHLDAPYHVLEDMMEGS